MQRSKKEVINFKVILYKTWRKDQPNVTSILLMIRAQIVHIFSSDRLNISLVNIFLVIG